MTGADFSSVRPFQSPGPMAPVQRKANGEQALANERAVGASHGEAACGAGVQEAAQAGVSGSGGPLPHLDRIQSAFGGHDVSGIQAHIGGRASEAAEGIGAEAYATGNHVAFASTPSLHTAAHEAAHVVQQRAGVALAGGVDRPGDSYEQRADAVADRVVAGESAADLLPPVAGHAVESQAVQRNPGKPKQPRPSRTLRNEWVMLRTPTPIFRETTPDDAEGATGAPVKRTFEKTDEILKGKDRIFQIEEDAGTYLRLTIADAAPDAEAKWVQRGEAKKLDKVVPLTGKTVEVVAPAEVEIPLGTHLKVENHDIDKGRVQVEVDGKLEWIGRSHVVEFDGTKALPEITPGDAASEDAAWTRFAEVFNAEFKDILHAFEVGGSTELDGVRAKKLFTEPQRDALVEFFTTKLIPDRLFTNDDGAGGCTAQQRILIAAHMFSVGKHQQEDDEGNPTDPDKLHARNCGHWVQTVNNYAGVTSNTGDSGTGVKGSFDQAGNIILGGGHLRGGPAGKAVKAKDLPDGQREDIGRIEDDTPHGATRKKEDEAFDEVPPSPTTCSPDGAPQGPDISSDTCGDTPTPARKDKDRPAKRKVVRFPHIPFDQYGSFVPGDWLWLYNANSSASGGHSVIFNEWVDGTLTKKTDSETGVTYAEAWCYGQPNPEVGGKPHKYKFGPKFGKKDPLYNSIYPITARFASDTDSAPADTLDEVLPMSASTRAKAEKANKGFMAASGKGKKRREALDADKLRDSLREANVWFIAAFGDRLTPGQVSLLEKINDEEDLVTLVALWERLHALHTNAGVLAKAEAKNTKKPRMIHGAGSLNGEAKSKLTGKLSSVEFIRKHRSDYGISEEPEEEPAPDTKLDDDALRP